MGGEGILGNLQKERHQRGWREMSSNDLRSNHKKVYEVVNPGIQDVMEMGGMITLVLRADLCIIILISLIVPSHWVRLSICIEDGHMEGTTLMFHTRPFTKSQQGIIF